MKQDMRLSTRNKIMKLEDIINTKKEEDFEKIVKCVIKAINEYKDNHHSWNGLFDEVCLLFYKAFEHTYNLSSTQLFEIYKEVKKFDVNDIKDLTYALDGKTIEQRLKEYWDESKLRLDNQENPDDVKAYLINRYDRILTTETRVIECKVKKYKKPLRASILVIESGGCPECKGGEYPADEDVEWPPYHPECQCCAYYVETDDEDDINDLDLELEV